MSGVFVGEYESIGESRTWGAVGTHFLFLAFSFSLANKQHELNCGTNADLLLDSRASCLIYLFACLFY